MAARIIVSNHAYDQARSRFFSEFSGSHANACRGIEDAENFMRALVNRWVARHGAHLDYHDHEDLTAYLSVLMWRLAERYDASEGISFSRYVTQVSEKRIVDWLRKRKVSRRL